MKSKIKIGIIGTGVGIRTHFNVFKSIEQASVIGIVGSSFERAKEFANEYEIEKPYRNYKDLCNDKSIDLVCITSPNLHHYEEVKYAIKKNKNLLVEKPFVMSFAQNEELIKLSLDYPKLCLVNHQLRFNPYIHKVKELLTSDKLGRIYHIKIHQQGTGFSNRNAKWIWSFDENKGGGVRLAMASHLIDLINFWLPKKRIFSVKGSMDSVVEKRIDNYGKLTDVKATSFFSADISMEDKLNVQLSATAAAFGSSLFNFSIYGTKGELQFDLKNKIIGSYLDSSKLEEIEVKNVFQDERENKKSIFSGSFRYFAPEIIKSISENSKKYVLNAASFKDSLQTQIVLDLILQSAKTGNSVLLNNGFICNATI